MSRRLSPVSDSDTWTRSSASTRPSTSNVTTSARPTGSASQQLDLAGIFPPIATPFDSNELVDYDKLGFNLHRWNDIPFKGTVGYNVYSLCILVRSWGYDKSL